MTWFERLTGFPERSPEQVRAKLEVDGTILRSLASGRAWTIGDLEIPSLAELRAAVRSGYVQGEPPLHSALPAGERASARASTPGQAFAVRASTRPGDPALPSAGAIGEGARVRGSHPGALARPRLSLREVVADVKHLHQQPSNAGALFQVASQFNLLEMAHPTITPEQGVGIYEGDETQGPACAMAAGAGTIYRNYFVVVNGHPGQTTTSQIDCLAGQRTRKSV